MIRLMEEAKTAQLSEYPESPYSHEVTGSHIYNSRMSVENVENQWINVGF